MHHNIVDVVEGDLYYLEYIHDDDSAQGQHRQDKMSWKGICTILNTYRINVRVRVQKESADMQNTCKILYSD
jgi:uncharacterized protein (DUF1786 family)